MEASSESILYYIDELKADELNTRLYAINSLDLIASAIGEEKTRNELVPYTNELLEDENEEVLLALASKLGELYKYIGPIEHISCLLPPLATLCSSDEPCVQNKAINSLFIVSAQIPLSEKVNLLSPILNSLCSSSWCSGRVAACSIFSIVFQELDPTEQETMLDVFIKLGCDDSPAVRKASANNLGKLFKILPSEKLKRLFRNLIEDENEGVKQMTLSCADQIIVNGEELILIMQKFAVDKSWRIRYVLLENIEKLAAKIESFKPLMREILGLIKDSEAEVRALAISQLGILLNKLPKNEINEIIPCFDGLSQDCSFHVRLALLQTLCKIGKFVDYQVSIQKVFPLINNLIRDENFEVRMGFAENFALFNQNISDKCVLSFSIPIIMQMMNDPRWRIRLKIVESLPSVANILGSVQFTEQISAPLMKWVEDPAFGVRQATIQSIFTIANSFGKDWTRLHILPLIVMLVNSPVFSKRMTALKAINQLIGLFEYEEYSSFLQILACDKIPNIRFNVMKTIKNMRNLYNVQNDLVRVVDRLRGDLDSDVRFYANETAEALNKI